MQNRKEKNLMREMEAAVEMASDRWEGYFDTALLSVLDNELTEERTSNMVKLAATVADRALEAYEERWGKR